MPSNQFKKYFAVVTFILAGFALVPSRLSAQAAAPPANACLLYTSDAADE